MNSLLIDGGTFIWKALDGAAVTLALASLDEQVLQFGDSTITQLSSNTVKVNIPPNQLDIVETFGRC